MIKDSEWHKGVIIRDPSGNFCLFESCDEFVKIKKPNDGGTYEYNDVLYNWNKGQPKITTSNGVLLKVVDISKSHSKGFEGTMLVK